MSYAYCQSCARVIHNPRDLGTEADGSLNHDFCRRCYAEGCFTEPRLTRRQIISRIVPLWMKENNLTYREALVDVNHFISGLRRWQTHKTWT
ncbi:hypothetical protein CEE36_00520 [candidate division TA06 bacterium B3_TA06]|uniref:Putative zinc ribbon domain-containing protein n=1 Tax=candidate division TA06 bacterium B3_TA06 TaxID=2012487 RepID=A0A532VAN0_UNCT6|nr:MAG: hypothetical protein CEE36_00520 [candidate division TA06 bacterium B3_TA06]